MRHSTHSLLLLIITLICGCSSVYWEDWKYEGTDLNVSRSQKIHVTSSPKSSVYSNGEYIGKTPFNLEVGYTENTTKLSRRQMEKTLFGKAIVINREKDEKTSPNSGAHHLTFSADGYDNLNFPLTVPLDPPSLNVILKRAGRFTDPFWQLKNKQRETKSQRITVTSEPPAYVFLDGRQVTEEMISKTELPLSYEITALDLEKNTYMHPAGDKFTRVDKEKSTDQIIDKTHHLLRFEKRGFAPLEIPVTVPMDDPVVNAKLKRANVPRVHCIVHVEGRIDDDVDYFAPVEQVIPDYALGGNFRTEYESPIPKPKRDKNGNPVLDKNDNPIIIEGVFLQTYIFMIPDLITFDLLVTAINEEAEKHKFVFQALWSRLEVMFSTNVMKNQIKHVIHGTTQPEATLYYVESPTSIVPKVVSKTDGSYSFETSISANQPFVYMISNYEGLLIVYKRMNVFEETEEEISREEFLAEAGISAEQLDEIIK